MADKSKGKGKKDEEVVVVREGADLNQDDVSEQCGVFCNPVRGTDKRPK